MEINFALLKKAVKISELGSINKAAKELYLAQPSLNNSIKKLEEELGFQIFKRNSTGVTLTEKGEVFYRLASNILSEYKQMLELSDNNKEKPLAIFSTQISYISSAFFKFKKRTPINEKELFQEVETADVIAAVEKKIADMGIIMFMMQEESFFKKYILKHHCRCEKLFSSLPMYVMSKKNHPITKNKTVSLEDLEKYPIVFYGGKVSQFYLKKIGYETFENFTFIQKRSELFDAVQSGEYISFITFTHESKRSDFSYIPIKDKRLWMEIYYIVRKGHSLTKRERAFIEFLRDEICSI